MNPADFPCPICRCPNERLVFYNTSPDKRMGRYHCPDCGRDELWSKDEKKDIYNAIEKVKEVLKKWLPKQN